MLLSQPSGSMSLDTGRRLISYFFEQTVHLGVHVAAISSAVWCYTQLLPEENMALDEFVYDAEAPLETSEAGTLYRARRWAECKGVYKLVLWTSGGDAEREREAVLLRRLQGVPRVLQYVTHEAIEGQPGSFSLITERLQGGSKLSSLLASPAAQELTPVQRISMARQVTRDLLTALAGMHERSVAHGALSFDALYVQSSKSEDGARSYAATLTDFTSAVEFQEGKRVLNGALVELAGKDLELVAPEVLVRSLKGSDNGYPISASATDVWSAGILLLSVAARQAPFKAENSDAAAVKDLIRQHKTWETAVHQRKSQHPLLKLLDTAPRDLAVLAVRMLQVDPARRISAATALQHPFFAAE
jgi:serine/threonine protein kinase